MDESLFLNQKLVEVPYQLARWICALYHSVELGMHAGLSEYHYRREDHMLFERRLRDASLHELAWKDHVAKMWAHRARQWYSR